MGITIETIRRFRVNNRNREGGSAGEELRIEVQRQQTDTEARRQTDIKDRITAFNDRVKTDSELQKTIAITIRDHPQRTSYASPSKLYSGVIVASDFVETALLTENGIECFRLKAPLNFISQGKWQTYEAAKPIPLEETGLGYVFNQTRFPSAEDVAQKIQALLFQVNRK